MTGKKNIQFTCRIQRPQNSYIKIDHVRSIYTQKTVITKGFFLVSSSFATGIVALLCLFFSLLGLYYCSDIRRSHLCQFCRAVFHFTWLRTIQLHFSLIFYARQSRSHYTKKKQMREKSITRKSQAHIHIEIVLNVIEKFSKIKKKTTTIKYYIRNNTHFFSL